MNEDLLRMRNDVKFCTFDFETEDLNLYTSKPWQFACVVATNQAIIRKRDIYLRWPDLNISKEAEQITRFNRLHWKDNAMDPKEAFEIIHEEFDEADYICGHNILGYDINIYRSSCRKLGIKPRPIHYKMIDSMCFGKGIKLETHYKKGENPLLYQQRMLETRVEKRGFATLAAFCKLYEIQTDETKLHDALYDVTVNWEVIKKMLWHVEL